MNSEGSVSTGFYEFLGWLEENKKRVAVAAIIVVVAGFAIFIWRHQVAARELRASDALLTVRAPAGTEAGTAMPPAADFIRVTIEHEGTEAAVRGEFLAAGAYFSEGKYDKAHQQFESFLQKHGESRLAASAAYGVGAALEAQGKKDEALTAYQNLVTRYPNAAEVTQAKLAVGRLYEAKGQNEQAFRSYEEIVNMTNTTWRGQAKLFRDTLVAKHPDLEKKSASAPKLTPGAGLAPGPTNAQGKEKALMKGSNAATSPAATASSNAAPGLATNAAGEPAKSPAPVPAATPGAAGGQAPAKQP